MSPAARPFAAAAKTLRALPALAAAAWKSVGASVTFTGSSFGEVVRGLFAGGDWYAAAYKRLARLAYTNPIAGRGLRLIAQTLAEAPLYVERRTPDGGYAQVEGFERELDLLDRPSDRMTRETVALAIVTALYCGGEFWVDASAAPITGANAGRPRSLRFILPDEFVGFIRDGATDEIVGYQFKTRRRGTPYTRMADVCRHVRMFHPTDEDRGLPILVSAAAEIEGMAAMTAWNAALSKGGGRLTGIWRPTGLGDGTQLSEEQQNAAQASLNRLLQNVQRDGTEQVVSGALERVAADSTPRDADFSKAVAGHIRQIAAVLGVPPVLIGDEKAGSLTDAGVNSEVAALYKLTVLPLLRFVLAELSALLLPPETRFAVDTDQIDALGEDADSKATRFALLARGPDALLSRNEAREGLGHRPTTPDGSEWREGVVTAFDVPGGIDSREAAPPPEAPFVRSLKALSDDGLDALLSLIPASA